MIRNVKIRDGLKNPKKAIRYVASIPRMVVGSQLNKHLGEKVLHKDWDNLIILDACRYDLFQQTVSMDGQLDSLRSSGSSSYEYFLNNFGSGSYPDVVYITANTWIHKIDAEFYDTFHLREQIWDDSADTVLPSDVADFVLDIENEYRDKRIIVHLMQPHMPFLRSTDEGLVRHPVSLGSGLSKYGDDKTHEVSPWWVRLENGELTREEAWDGYKETLEVTLPHVQRMIDGLPGKSVISADHGNGFGEDGIYGHPHNRSHESLVRVPWFTVDSKTRKEIVAGEKTVDTNISGEIDKSKLRALGYVE